MFDRADHLLQAVPMVLAAAAIYCAAFCTARMYEGGISSPDKKACFCYERVELKTPAAIENFSLKLNKPPKKQDPYPEDYSDEF